MATPQELKWQFLPRGRCEAAFFRRLEILPILYVLSTTQYPDKSKVKTAFQISSNGIEYASIKLPRSANLSSPQKEAERLIQ